MEEQEENIVKQHWEHLGTSSRRIGQDAVCRLHRVIGCRLTLGLRSTCTVSTKNQALKMTVVCQLFPACSLELS